MSAMVNKKWLFLICFAFTASWSYAQYSYKDLDEFQKYREAVELYNKNAFSQVIPLIDEFLQDNRRIYESDFRNIKIHAELLKAQSALYNDDPDGENLLVGFIDKYQPDPQANEALYNLADHYFRSRKYDLAIKYYTRIGENSLEVGQIGEAAFKLGYSYFVKKDFEAARDAFLVGRNHRGNYYYDLNYYYGMTSYFLEDYREAIRAWQIAQEDKTYQRLIPYYLTQIYFSEGDYQKVISYALPYAEDTGVQNQKEINQLIGQSYFELKDYKNAQRYLEEYEAHSNTMRAEDFYQLAYVQYKNGDYAKAIPNFQELSNEKNTLGQTAMYYLAESNLQTGNRASARNAFYNVVQYEDNMSLRENALFNYGKLSAELGYDMDAINAFSKFLPTSKYYNESQDLMAELLTNTSNFKKSMEILEKMNDLSPGMQMAYQTVSLRQARQDLKENRMEEALASFDKSLKHTPSTAMQTEAFFWMGEILNRQGKYAESESAFNKYLALYKTNPVKDPHVNPGFAYYTQGYNYIRSGQSELAIQSFQKAITALDLVSTSEVAGKERIVGDAYIRIGDNYFKLRNYNQAFRWYDQAAEKRVPGFDYALYQKAQIMGLQNNRSGEISALNRLIQEAPDSRYADQALYEQSDAYIQMNQMDQAVTPLLTLVQKYKGRSNLINPAYFKLGLIEYNRGRSDQALAFYQEILKNNPTSEESSNALAAIEEIYVTDQGNPDAYFKVLESVPGMKMGQKQRDSLQYSVANNFYQNGNYEKAAEAFGEYLNRYPNGFYTLDAYYNRGESHVLLKQFSRALADYEKVVNLGNSSYFREAVKKAAIIAYNDQQDFEKALKYYTQYEKLASGDEEKLQIQSNALKSAFEINNQEAIVEFAQKIKDNPLAGKEQKSLAHFNIAQHKIRNNQSKNALADLEYVVENSNNVETAEARFLIAKIYYDENQMEKASEKVKDAYSKNGGYPKWVAKSLLLNAKILMKQNDIFNAKASVEAVIDNFAGDSEIIAESNVLLEEIRKMESEQSRIQRPSNQNELELDYGNQ